VKNDLVEKIYKALTGSGELSEAEVRSMMVIFRKLLDNMSEEDQQKFLVIRLFSNWALHNEIRNSITGLRILSAVNDALVKYKDSPTDDAIEGISNEFGLIALLEELQLFLRHIGIEPSLLLNSKSWQEFISHLIEIVRDVPVIFPDLASLDKKKQKIYNEISRNPIKPGAGVIAINLSVVDYDALGAKGMGKVWCIIVTTADTTRVVVPFKIPQFRVAAVA
jgi:hypothetical protein